MLYVVVLMPIFRSDVRGVFNSTIRHMLHLDLLVVSLYVIVLRKMDGCRMLACLSFILEDDCLLSD